MRKRISALVISVSLLSSVFLPQVVLATENFSKQNIQNKISLAKTPSDLNEEFNIDLYLSELDQIHNYDNTYSNIQPRGARYKLDFFKEFVNKLWKKVKVTGWQKFQDMLLDKVLEYKDTKTGVATNPSYVIVGYSGQTEGKNVSKVQKLLREQGYNITIDGKFGPKTEKAIKDFQKGHGLKVDGIVGYNTWEELHGKGHE